MRPTIQLINALRRAADRIKKEPHAYWWFACSSCNCGILAREVTDRPQIIKLGWREDAIQQEKCRATGEPLNELFQALESAGLELGDIADIEFLGNPEIAAGLGLRSVNVEQGWRASLTTEGREAYTDPVYVIRYFRAQADILAEQLGDQFETRELQPIAKPALA